MFQPFHRLVVQVHMGYPERRRTFHLVPRPASNRKTVILCGDFHRTVLHSAYRVIGRPVPVQELVGLRAEGPTEQLVAQTNSENRDTPLSKGPNGLQCM